ncbi:MAG: invasion associated locus B family protein [Gammaproteobacteria bacterium]|nr:invasion associated locus B family protein [Gammaproteobacteria bacterium]
MGPCKTAKSGESLRWSVTHTSGRVNSPFQRNNCVTRFPIHGPNTWWFVGLLLSSAAGPLWAESQTFGSWTAKCEAPKGGIEGGCFIYQNLVLREGGQRVLQVAVGYVPNSQEPIALLSLPLGISLPPGVSIEIKSNEPLRFPVERCEPNGCRAGLKLKQEFVTKLAQAEQMTVRFHDAQRQPIEVPLSLKGLAEGLEALTRQTPLSADPAH